MTDIRSKDVRADSNHFHSAFIASRALGFFMALGFGLSLLGDELLWLSLETDRPLVEESGLCLGSRLVASGLEPRLALRVPPETCNPVTWTGVLTYSTTC